MFFWFQFGGYLGIVFRQAHRATVHLKSQFESDRTTYCRAHEGNVKGGQGESVYFQGGNCFGAGPILVFFYLRQAPTCTRRGPQDFDPLAFSPSFSCGDAEIG